MSASIRGAKSLPFFPTTIKSFTTRGKALLVSGCLPATISAALVREEEKVQKPMYYASRVFHGAEKRYPPMEKLAFALVIAAYKLKPYFQAHTVIILTNKPLRRALSNPETVGRMAIWVIKLSEFMM